MIKQEGFERKKGEINVKVRISECLCLWIAGHDEI